MRKIFFLATVLIIFSCQEQNEPPVINSINLTSSNIQKVEGAFLEFNYDFSDDSGLNQFRASVLDNFEDARLQSALGTGNKITTYLEHHQWIQYKLYYLILI